MYPTTCRHAQSAEGMYKDQEFGIDCDSRFALVGPKGASVCSSLTFTQCSIAAATTTANYICGS
jgi:hypothetical protein